MNTTDVRSGDIVENIRTGRTYRVSFVNYTKGTTRAVRVTVDAAGQWYWFVGAKVTTLKLALCRPYTTLTTQTEENR